MAVLAVLLRPEPEQPEYDGPVLPAERDGGGPPRAAFGELDPLELLRWVAADFDPMNASAKGRVFRTELSTTD